MSSKRRSLIWYHFDEIGDGRARCVHCKSTLGIKGGSTGNLGRHLRKKHPSLKITINLENVKIVKDDSIESVEPGKLVNECFSPSELDVYKSNETSSINKQETSETTAEQKCSDVMQYVNIIDTNVVNMAHDQDQLDASIVKMITKGYHTFRIVEEQGFRDMVYAMCPEYNMPDYETVSNVLVPHMYFSAKELLKIKISDISSFCITIDSWDSYSDEIHFSVTAHYVAENAEINSSLLDCMMLYKNYTTEHLTNALQKVFTDWEISEKISVVITDKGQEINNWEHLPCLLHSINAVVQAGFNNVSESIHKTRKIIQYLKTVVGAEHFRLKQQELNLPLIKLKADEPLNWLSTYNMFSGMLKAKDAIVSLINEFNMNSFDYNEWDIIEQVVKLLAVFNEVVQEIINEKIVPVSKLVIYINAMKKHVSKQRENRLDKVQSMIYTLESQLNEHFKDTEDNDFILQAIVLDPRIKMYGFSDGNKYLQACNSLRNIMRSVEMETDEYVNNKNVTVDDQHGSSSLCWNDFDKEVNKYMAVQAQTAACMIELDKYLDDIVINRKQNHLLWWKERKCLYPRLYEIVKARLCILAASISQQQMLTKSGRILSERKKYLPSSKVAEILFLSVNT